MRFLMSLTVLIFVLRTTPAAGEDYVARFNAMDRRINNGQGYSESLNKNGELAWGESYILMGYVEMYRATDDPSYLDRLVEHFDRILRNRDDRRAPSVKDYYRKVPLAGWGSDEYSKSRWHVWAVHTGMICQAPMDFVALVKARLRLRKRFAAKQEEYLARIRESVAAHDPEWRNGPGPDEGYYVDPGIGPLPLNQQNALGTVILGLYLVTRDHVYKERATRLANFMRNRLRRTPDGAFDWSYWPRPDGTGAGSEDISHAAINIEFAVRCREAHIVFDEGDMKAFANTWTAYVRRADGEWADTVGGGGGPNTHIPQALGRWLDLCRYDRKIFEDAKQAFAALDDEQGSGGANMLGLAKLARWQKEFTRKKGFRLPRIRL
jgi:hypothetical protein